MSEHLHTVASCTYTVPEYRQISEYESWSIHESIRAQQGWGLRAALRVEKSGWCVILVFFWE